MENPEKELLRDAIAIVAMHGILTSECSTNKTWEQIAYLSYGMASSMLKAREPAPKPAQDNVDTWEVN